MNSRLALITFVDAGPVDPGYGVAGGRPDNSLPSGGAHPDQSLPGGGHVDNSLPQPGMPVQLPVYPFDPTNPHPDQGLPPQASTMPIYPGAKFVVKWLSCKGLVLVPDNSLPGAGSGHPDQGLPGGIGSGQHPSQGLPGQPGRPDQGLPPTAQPKK